MRLNETIIQKSKILKTIIQKIEKDLPNDISVLVCYGSFITGKMHKYSDIDFFFIPKTENGYKLAYQFIIKEIGYDLWPISWNRAEKISKLQESLQSIFIDGKVLYFSTNEDLHRYDELVTRLKDNLQNKSLSSKPEIGQENKQEKQQDSNRLIGFYEEFKSIYNKLRYSCETENIDLARYSAVIIDRETSTILKPFTKTLEFPSLVQSLRSKDFQKIQGDCNTHEKIFLEMLKSLDVPLNIFSSIEEFETTFNQRV